MGFSLFSILDFGFSIGFNRKSKIQNTTQIQIKFIGGLNRVAT
jgi:hypothetical protein